MIRIRALCIMLLAVLLSGRLYALPRFASRTGLKCQSCHVDPTGGEMRQTFGVQYGREQLPVPEWAKESELEDFSNVITNVLGVGADFRTLYYNQELPRANGIFKMQGDLYVNLRVAKKVFLFLNLNKGVNSGFDAYALFNVLPASGHLQVGKFVPNYGTKVDDHTAYIRQYTDLSPQFTLPEKTGAEAAISPGPFTIMAGVYNADEGTSLPNSNDKAFLGRAEGMFRLGDQMFLGLGGNAITKRVVGTTHTFYGGFGSFSLGNFTLLGEADWLRSSTGGTDSTGLVTYAEGDYMVIQGIDLKLAYDFHDSNIKYKTGAQSRYTVGVEFFPVSGVEVRPQYRLMKAQNPDSGIMNEFDVMLHIYL